MSCPNVDWSTFTFIAGTGQTLVSPTELTGVNGTAIFNPGNKTITYELGTVSCGVDPIQFHVEDTDGNISNISTWYVDTNAIVAPSLSADSVTVAANSVTDLDVSANDTGNINKATYEIVTQPTKTTVSGNSGTFTIVAPSTAEGSDSFTYRAATPEGVYGSAATVTITIQNAGEGLTSEICPVSGINLNDYLDGSVTAGGTWTASANNPATPSIVDPTSVNFSAVKAGTYQFTYTIGDSEATITLLLLDYGTTINSVSTPTSNPIATAVTSTITFTTVGVASADDIEIEVDFNSGTDVDTYPPDTWDAETGVGTVVVALNNGAGNYDITISVDTTCATTLTETHPTITL